MPSLSLELQVFFRTSYGALLLATLLMILPHARRFFLSERWQGYGESHPATDMIQNPVILPLILSIWFLCAALLTIGQWTVPASFFNLCICRYFFVQTRWKSILRGLGAPGFMTYWLGAAVFLLEGTLHGMPQLRSLGLLVLQIDFAFIMLSSGIYKLTAGYARGHGMEYGLVNPEWGYWPDIYLKLRPGHILFKIFNHAAWSGQIAAALMLLIPPLRFWGALILIVSFTWIATQIRLGLLCEMVMLGCLLFLGGPSPEGIALSQKSFLSSLAESALWLYLIFLPFAYAGLFYNLYARRSLGKPFQKILEAFTNFFGIILWRVFSVDVVNFFVRIYLIPIHDSTAPILISRYGWRGGLRFSHVGECITLTSIFTTLKYHPSDLALFKKRLIRYARSFAIPESSRLLFEYVSIVKENGKFHYRPVAEYQVDPRLDHVDERMLNPDFSVRKGHSASPIHEGIYPGSYAPLTESVNAEKN